MTLQKTREVLERPKNAKHKKMLLSVMPAQTPILRTKLGSNTLYQTILLYSKKLNRPEGLPFPSERPITLVHLARDVGDAWDETSASEKREDGLHEKFCTSPTQRAFFSLKGGGERGAMKFPYLTAINTMNELQFLIALKMHLRGKGTPEVVADMFLQAKGIHLNSIEQNEQGIVLLGKGTKIILLNLADSIRTISRKLWTSVNELAVRMCVGYNEEIWPGWIVRHLNFDLRSAASCGRNQDIEMLLDEGADINFTDKWGFTPLDAAYREGRTESVEFLKSRSAKRGKELR